MLKGERNLKWKKFNTEIIDVEFEIDHRMKKILKLRNIK
jgi:hypothetical protein